MMAQHPDRPQLARTALGLMEPRDRITPWINKYWAGGLGTFTGLLIGMGSNLAFRRPIHAGFQYSVLVAAVMGAGCHYAGIKREEYLAERDAIYKHYIELHPEDFVYPERVKYADVLEPWVPIR